VYTYTYPATGAEGYTLSIATLVNQDILLVFVGDKRLTSVSSSPAVNEYIYNAALGLFTFGVELQNGQIVQILYR
jgi:hypothetical protein